MKCSTEYTAMIATKCSLVVNNRLTIEMPDMIYTPLHRLQATLCISIFSSISNESLSITIGWRSHTGYSATTASLKPRWKRRARLMISSWHITHKKYTTKWAIARVATKCLQTINYIIMLSHRACTPKLLLNDAALMLYELDFCCLELHCLWNSELSVYTGKTLPLLNNLIIIFVFQISGCQTAPWFTMCALRPP